jgi:SOS response regulatory protein OraA/RecX
MFIAIILVSIIIFSAKRNAKPLNDSMVRYITKALGDGYSYDAIEKALRHKQIKSSIIRHHLSSLKSQGHRTKIRYNIPQTTAIPWNQQDKMVEMLKHYVQEQERHGFELRDIQDALLHYGHSEDLVHEALVHG